MPFCSNLACMFYWFAEIWDHAYGSFGMRRSSSWLLDIAQYLSIHCVVSVTTSCHSSLAKLNILAMQLYCRRKVFFDKLEGLGFSDLETTRCHRSAIEQHAARNCGLAGVDQRANAPNDSSHDTFDVHSCRTNGPKSSTNGCCDVTWSSVRSERCRIPFQSHRNSKVWSHIFVGYYLGWILTEGLKRDVVRDHEPAAVWQQVLPGIMCSAHNLQRHQTFIW